MVMNPEELRKSGVWLNQLKKILQLGAEDQRVAVDNPKAVHRSTKKSVKVLLSNLKKGASKQRDNDTTDEDIRSVIFNAVDLLIRDKSTKSDKKTTLEAIDGFEQKFLQEFNAQAQKKHPLGDEWKDKVQEALAALRQEAKEKAILTGSDSPDDKMRYAQDMLGTPEGRRALASKRELATRVFSSVDPVALQNFDFDSLFGADKEEVLSETLVVLAKKFQSPNDQIDRTTQFDPALFRKLAGEIPANVYNNQTATTPPLKGLGPVLCQNLWKNGNYDEICHLIDLGVDTSLASRASGAGGRGVYMGFVQPIQHVASTFIRDIAELEKGALTSELRKKEARGAKKIFEKLGNNAVTLTNWEDVEKSELITEFKKNPGTIWGFENVRLPFVQAAHETDQGAQPLRMLELWESVGEVTRNAGVYEDLLDKPQETIDKLVNDGVQKIRTALTNTTDKVKFAEVEGRIEEFITNFQRDAKAFLTEFVSQMPKGTFAHGKVEGTNSSVADLAGIMGTSVVGALACKAGLWWAQAVGKPVYYCLDGLNMDDVTNYKKMKNKAIDDFITNQGTPGSEDAHREVITLVEVREVLKNWDELQHTVKFVLKGKILKGDELQDKVKQWQKKMKKANEEAGRTPAPPRDTFAGRLNAIDPNLLGRLPPGKEGDMDARDIAKKFNYLVKMANTKPHIVLKYVLFKCEVFMKYGLVSPKLPSAVVDLNLADDKEIDAKADKLRRVIAKCHADLQQPLIDALVRHPRTDVKL